MKMHIVLVCREYVGSFRSGGIGSYMNEISNAYIKLGHHVTIVTASDDTRQEYETVSPEGVRIISLSGGDFLVDKVERKSIIKKARCIYRFNSYRKKLRRVIAKIPDVDIIEVADYGAEALYLFDMNIPVVIRLHTPQSLSRTRVDMVRPKLWQIHRLIPINAEKIIFEKARYITGCSNSILNWVANHFDISKAQTAVIYNPISHSRTVDVPRRRPDQDTKTIFYAGTISTTKGVGDLIDACEILIKQGKKIKLFLAGKGGSYQDSLQKKVVDNKWTWVEFLGKIPREQLYNYYMTADICCFPSWWENMPMVCLEAMACGAVVVSTNSGGTSEIITDGCNGFLTECQNPKELAKTMWNSLILKDSEIQWISFNARETILQNFSAHIIADKMLDFFYKVIESYKKEYKKEAI